MALRTDIEKGRLIYTQELGWIDLGHASGDDVRALWSQFEAEIPDPRTPNHFLVHYSQWMRKFHSLIAAGIYADWWIKRGLPLEVKRSIAYSMIYCVSMEFEALQSNVIFSHVTGSGFSGEDLTSNLLGFYKVMEPCMDYKGLMKPYPKEYAYKIWDHYGSIEEYKNDEINKFWFFPNPDKHHGTPGPEKKYLPDFLNSIHPYRSYSMDDDTVVRITSPQSLYW